MFGLTVTVLLLPLLSHLNGSIDIAQPTTKVRERNVFQMPGVLGRHEGEVRVYEKLRVPVMQNPAHPRLPAAHAQRVAESSLLALGVVDKEGRPWTTLLGGEAGFANAVAENVLGIEGLVDQEQDPVLKALWEGKESEDVVRGEGKKMSGLSIELMTRDRVKLAGQMLVAAKAPGGKVQMGFLVEECIGNCPKYINKRRIVPRLPEFGQKEEGRVVKGLPLGEEAVKLLGRADMLFLSSEHAVDGMDTNHRGGAKGFVRVERNDEGGVTLVYPEFSGNKLYSTLGNLEENSAVGVVIPDFETSNALFLTGHATILYGAEAHDVLPRSNLAVRITISDSVFIKSHLSFRESDEGVEYSPYNPPVRRLATEGDVPIAESGKGEITAKLVGREELTGSVNRYQFVLEGDGLKSVKEGGLWRAGQYVTLDFEEELGVGYAHMNDDDPQSLNEDYKRTFTISNVPGAKTMEITAKIHGPVTKFLSKHQMRVPLSVPVMGFGGQESFSLSRGLELADEVVFVAGGVGITPLLAQAPDILAEQVKAGEANKKKMTVLWSLRRDEVGLAEDSFQRGEGLAAVTRVFLTGERKGKEDEAEKLREMGAEVNVRRMGEGDLGEWKGRDLGFFACASGGMLVRIQGWLEGERLAWEEFAY